MCIRDRAYVVQHENEGYVLVKDIERKRGNVRAVALYNPSDTICSFTVPMNIFDIAKQNQEKAWQVIKNTNIIQIWEDAGAKDVYKRQVWS